MGRDFLVLLSFWNLTPSCMKFCAGLPYSDFCEENTIFLSWSPNEEDAFCEEPLYCFKRNLLERVWHLLVFESPACEHSILFSVRKSIWIVQYMYVFWFSKYIAYHFHLKLEIPPSIVQWLLVSVCVQHCQLKDWRFFWCVCDRASMIQ